MICIDNLLDFGEKILFFFLTIMVVRFHPEPIQKQNKKIGGKKET